MQAKSMKTLIVRFAAAGLILAATGAQADWSRGVFGGYGPAQALKQSQMFSQQIDARQSWQRARIEAGWRDGALTRHEFRTLMRQQHEIAAMARRFLDDGLLDAHEFRRLNEALDTAGRAIRTENHDRHARHFRDYRDYHPRYN